MKYVNQLKDIKKRYTKVYASAQKLEKKRLAKEMTIEVQELFKQAQRDALSIAVPYTGEDSLEVLAEKNPYLKKAIDKLDLCLY